MPTAEDLAKYFPCAPKSEVIVLLAYIERELPRSPSDCEDDIRISEGDNGFDSDRSGSY